MYRYTDGGSRKSRKWKAILIAACGILTILFLISVVYVSDYYHADDIAIEALVTDEAVKVAQVLEDMIVFSPEKPVAGLIFYPGGKVEYTAYAPLLHDLAAQGMLCVLVKMPCNLAVLDIDAAEGIQEMFPEIESWYIGGHSLGGSMATSYVAGHAEEYEGLILLASYSTEDISQSGLEVLSVYGSRDGVLDMEKYSNNLANLPDSMAECEIEDGCHAQFGSYGIQEGDGIPGISGEEQREITVKCIMEWVNGVF
ncbi:MAG: alpha/beta hydrolase [Lachnospiraceae bacterium]|nr:alpha/beta hydrolase [Lachnospiraceae bacterium]MDE7204872.1 alpha/beta hydrolase [Lachnospiraceae bacterium]